MVARCSLIAILGVVLACSGRGARAPASMADDVGTYRFEERIPSGEGGAAIVIEGVFVVRPDTILVDANPGPCRYDQRSTRGGTLTYTCPDYSLRFDRDDPVRRSSYSVIVTVLSRRTTCVRYTTNASGQQVCAQTRTETVESRVPRTGRLNVRRADPG